MKHLFHRFCTHWRRRYHVRQSAPAAPARVWPRFSVTLPANLPATLLAALFITCGAWVLVWHAQRLTALQAQLALQASTPPGFASMQTSLQTALPGLHFEVPSQTGISWVSQSPGHINLTQALSAGGTLWIMAGMRAAPAVKIDLCQQLADARHMLPIYVGYRFDDVLQWVRQNRQRRLPDAFGLKNTVLSDEAGPQFDLLASMGENGASGWRLQLRDGAFAPHLLSDADPAQVVLLGAGAAAARTINKQAWLQWGEGSARRALHLQHRPASQCAQGELQLQWFQPEPAPARARPRAWVQAFTAQDGAMPGMWLAAGAYQIPATPKPLLEDQQLFEAALQGGLLRLSSTGRIELVPREATQAAIAAAGNWPDLLARPALRQLFKRMYMAADGAYVRQQIALFNREQGSSIAPGDLAYRHIRLQKAGDGQAGQLQWHAVNYAMNKGAGLAANSTPGPLTVSPANPAQALEVQDRNGKPLWRNGEMTAPAAQAGLAALLLGSGAPSADASTSTNTSTAANATATANRNGLPAMLARAGLSARLTLDLEMQHLAQQIVQCVGMQQARWDGHACIAPAPAANGKVAQFSAARRAAMLVLDADSGEILASASAGPAGRPLLGWQHDGSSHASPGSTFKVVSSLALEKAAESDASLQAMLGGVALPELNRIAARQGFAFRSDGACYPMPCDARAPHVTNFRDHILRARAQDGRFGLAQALAYSMNTWFAWQGEWVDASLMGQASGGVPDLLGLQSTTLAAQRPLLATSWQLGFERPLRLDGGCLPANFGWQAADVLAGSVSHIDVTHSRHELRQIAIGLRMQTHVLQMAQVAAGIATGQVRTPSLLQSVALPGAAPCQRAAPEKIGVRLDRIRDGMQGVVQYGTAAQAFAGAPLNSVRPFLYGKTGTAPVGPDTNSAWFIGYLDTPAADPLIRLPANTRRLAFAAWVSHTELTGGAHAAPMVAALLAGLPPRPAVK